MVAENTTPREHVYPRTSVRDGALAPRVPRHRRDAAPALRLDRERGAEPARLLLLGRAGPLAVVLVGHGDRRVPKLPREPLHRRSVLERNARERVAEAMERAQAAALADTRHAGALQRRIEHSAQDVLVRQVAAVLALEHEPLAARLFEPLLEHVGGL